MMKLSELLYELRQRRGQVAELERMFEEGEYDSDEERLVPIRGWGYWRNIRTDGEIVSVSYSPNSRNFGTPPDVSATKQRRTKRARGPRNRGCGCGVC